MMIPCNGKILGIFNMKENKQLLFSVTAADCEWSYTKGSGPGGQARNKIANAVHCSHRPSRAHGFCQDSRSLHDNKKTAFMRMIETKEFKEWHRLEIMKQTGHMHRVDEEVKRELKRIKVEIKQDGKWVEVDKNDPLADNAEIL